MPSSRDDAFALLERSRQAAGQIRTPFGLNDHFLPNSVAYKAAAAGLFAYDPPYERKNMAAADRHASKVPEVTVVFWIMKIAATTLVRPPGHNHDDSELGLSRWDSDLLFRAGNIGRFANCGEKLSPGALLGHDCRIHHRRNDDGRLSNHSLGVGYAGGSSILFVCLMAVLEPGIGHSAPSPWRRSPHRKLKRSIGPP